MRKLMFLLAFMCLFLISVTSAAIVETELHPFSVTNQTVPMFDATLGNLDKVTLSITAYPSVAMVTVHNTVNSYDPFYGPLSPGSGPFEISVSERVTVDVLGKFGISAPKATSQASGLRDMNPYDITTFVIGPIPSDVMSGENDSEDITGDLSDFVGVGNLNVVFAYSIWSSATIFYNVGGASNPYTFNEDVGYSTGIPRGTLTYTYTVPEPATMSLFVLASLAVIRRKPKA